MKVAVLQPNQSSIDMALMACGTLEGMMSIMLKNEASITGGPASGTQYTIPDDTTTDNYSLQYLQQNKIVIGTKG